MPPSSDLRPSGSPVVDVTVGDDESTLAAVVRAVSAVEGVEPTDLPPLYEAVDPDALDRLVQSIRSAGFVVFSYADYTVAVHADDVVEVYEEG
ncbi:MAG: HalOD1 output domain-containing protein [Haloferacaceae archaeon]